MRCCFRTRIGGDIRVCCPHPGPTGQNCDLRGIRSRSCRLFPRAGTQLLRGRDGCGGGGRREGPGRRAGDGPQGGGRLATSEHDGRSGEVLKGEERKRGRRRQHKSAVD